MAEATISAPERLRIMEEALRFSGVGLYRYRYDGTVLDMSQVAFDIFDLGSRFRSPADVIGRNIEDLLVYVGPRRLLRSLVRVRGEARNVLYPFRTLSGKMKWVVHDSFPIVDPVTGEEVIQAIIKDVTQAHEREEALRSGEERLERIIEAVAEGIVIVDRSGRFTFANAAAENIVGVPRAVITQRSVSDPAWKLTDANGRPIAREQLPFERVMRTGQPVRNALLAMQGPDGRRITISLNAVPLRDPQGAIMGVVESLTDVSERLRLERLRDEFLSTAAHELKTPVATIKGYAQLLQQWAPGGHESREAAAFAIINRQSDRLSRLVQGLIEFARLQHERFELRRQRFDLRDLAAEVVARMQTTAPGHRLTLQRDGTVPVDADRDRIDEVLTNLLDNAIKASPKGGEIETRVYREGPEARACVVDHGVGIPAELQPHIFERFFQAHAGTPYDRGGMGMGLYLSREIIARHGGKMWFQSVWGQGSTFCFSLPLAEGDTHGR